jgi:XRE family transcriptional regulator, regulator of sulfur utilization
MPKPKPHTNADLLRVVGDRVRTLRRKRNWTQEDLAAKADMDRTFIADIERGKRNFTLVYIDVLATAFDLTLAQFFSGVSAKRLDDNP